MKRFKFFALFCCFSFLGPFVCGNPWEDYILEPTDIVSLELTSDAIPEDALEEINGNHLIGPDGSITLGKFGRVNIEELTLEECSEAVRFHLAKQLDEKPIEIKTDLFAANSKRYCITFMSAEHGEQTMIFTYAGNTTIADALRELNSEKSLELQEGTNKNFHVLRSEKPGKPVQMIPVDFDAVLADTNDENGDDTGANLLLKPGDTLLLTQGVSRDHPLRPDGMVDSIPILAPKLDAEWNESEEIAMDDIPLTPPRFEVASIHEKFLDEYETENVEEPAKEISRPAVSLESKRIARTVYFDMKSVGYRIFVDSGSVFSEKNLEIPAFMESLKDELCISFVYNISGSMDPTGVWLILFGEEEIVEELYKVFKEIAESDTKE